MKDTVTPSRVISKIYHGKALNLNGLIHLHTTKNKFKLFSLHKIVKSFHLIIIGRLIVGKPYLRILLNNIDPLLVCVNFFFSLRFLTLV